MKRIYYGNFLSRHGWNITMPEEIVRTLKERNYDVVYASHYWNRVLRMLDVYACFFRYLFTKSVSVINLYTGPFYYINAIVLTSLHRWFGKKYMLVLHGGNIVKRYEENPVYLDRMFKGAEKIISPSAYFVHYFKSKYDVIEIPNTLKYAHYYPASPANRQHILYFRTFHKFYDPNTLIKAFALMAQEFPKATLNMYGYDEDGNKTTCEQLIHELKLEERVFMYDRVNKEDIPRFADGYGTYVNSSVVDNTPVSTMEAMAMGMSIVATTTGGIPFLLKDGVTALLVPPQDPEAMANALRTLFTDESKAHDLAENARKEAARFDHDTVMEQWITLQEKYGK